MKLLNSGIVVFIADFADVLSVADVIIGGAAVNDEEVFADAN